MKANTKVQDFVGPIQPKVKVPKVKIMKTPVLYLAPTKTEVKSIYDTEILELEARLQDLKSKRLELFGKESNYKVPVNQGVGAFIRDQILLGLGNTAILRLVEAKYLNNNTTYACVAWYRNDMKKLGLI